MGIRAMGALAGLSSALLGMFWQPGGGEGGRPAPSNENWQLATRPAGFIAKTIDVGGAAYPYVVYAPREYHPQSKQRPWPTIVFLHGAGECGTDGLKQIAVGLPQHIMRDRERWPFLVICPQKPERQKQWEDYDAVVMAMLEATKKEYPVDPEHVYLTGLSQGGHGTWTIGAKHPDIFAALAPVCGYSNIHGMGGDPATLAMKIKAVPVWAFHGGKDDVVPPSQTTDMIEAIRKTEPDHEPKLTIFPDANHNSWDKAYGESDLPGWFLAQVKASR